jgi:hypothetical protein
MVRVFISIRDRSPPDFKFSSVMPIRSNTEVCEGTTMRALVHSSAYFLWPRAIRTHRTSCVGRGGAIAFVLLEGSYQPCSWTAFPSLPEPHTNLHDEKRFLPSPMVLRFARVHQPLVCTGLGLRTLSLENGSGKEIGQERKLIRGVPHCQV